MSTFFLFRSFSYCKIPINALSVVKVGRHHLGPATLTNVYVAHFSLQNTFSELFTDRAILLKQLTGLSLRILVFICDSIMAATITPAVHIEGQFELLAINN